MNWERLLLQRRIRLVSASLGSWHSTTELLPLACVFRYLTVLQGFSRSAGQSIQSRKSIPAMGSDRKMDSKTDSKPSGETSVHEPLSTGLPLCCLPSHDKNNISQ
jgi:hypothetical protein